MTRLAKRAAAIEPFFVMDVLARARALEARGRSVIHLEIGEPDFPTAPAIVEAGIAALRAGRTHYTPALGLAELRAAIAASYPAAAGVSADRVVVTPGASGALLLALAALVDPGDEVLMGDPGYPCNRHFARLFEGSARSVPLDAASGYALTDVAIGRHWGKRTVAAMVASPANPTGAVVVRAEMARLIDAVTGRGGALIVDEIYHGLVYDADVETALAQSREVFVVNSFSKYYGMTGWRVGWLVVPERYREPVDRLAQNIFIAASTPAQYAALTALSENVRPELERRRAVFRERRDYLVPALRALGFGIPFTPQGAFYVYADCSAFTDDSEAFGLKLLEETGVAITPGRDFGSHEPRRYVRFSYANTLENLRLAVQRIKDFLAP